MVWTNTKMHYPKVLLTIPFLVLLSVWTWSRAPCVSGAPLTGDIHRQWMERQRLVDIITSPLTQAGTVVKLNKEEFILDRYLGYLRQTEVEKDLFSVPIEDSFDAIIQSDLFQILRPMPKGGNMHIHENHILSRRILLDLVWQSDDFPHLYILPTAHPTRPLEMDFFINPPENEPWLKVKGHDLYTNRYLVENLNHIDILKAKNPRPSSFDARRRWKDTNPLWSSFSKVIANVQIKVKYIEAVVRTSLEDGVQYLESKKSFGTKERLYALDNDPEYRPTHGKRFLEETAGLAEIPLVKGVLNGFMPGKGKNSSGSSSDNSGVRFSGMKRLVQSVRNFPKDRVHEDAVRAIQLHKLHPDNIAGFDLAGEEDTGFSNFHHSESLRMVAEFSRETNNSFRFVSHAGETSYNGDARFRPQEDTQAHSISNVLDAILLNASRIGHALSAFKTPELMRLMKERNIAIEVCPVVNHLMGNVPDIRNHPAIAYYQAGIPIVLGSDSHGIFGFEYFTVVWYTVYTAWDIGLRDLKQFAYQSLVYSAMNETEKEAAIADWKVAWDHYVTSVVATVCAVGTGSDATHSGVFNVPSISLQVIPPLISQWALDQNDSRLIDMHIYGEDFSAGICKELFCKVDGGPYSVLSYVTSEHLVCHLRPSDILETTHGQKNQQKSFNVFISFDGNSFIKINQTIVVDFN